MKKTLLLLSILVSFLGSEAQTTKKNKKAKKTKISREALFQARMDSLQAQRQFKIDSTIAFQFKTDSVRKENERIAEEKVQQERLARKAAKDKEIDSTNSEQAKAILTEQKRSSALQDHRNEISRAAKLNDYQKQQVNYILQSFYVKAQRIKKDSSLQEEQKQQQLTKLNVERRGKLKSLLGKSKEKKLEKARKSHNNNNDTESQWISEAEGYAKN